MAKDKISFLLYCDYLGVFEQLSDREAGLLIKHIMRYVNDKNPETDNRIISMAFEPIKLQLKRDLKKWERYIGKQSENGKLGGRPKKAKESQKTQAFFQKPKKADTVLVLETETDTVVDTNILNEIDIGKTIQFSLFSLNREYTGARVAELWEAFLINGQQPSYPTKQKKIQHFRNWLKTQPYESKAANVHRGNFGKSVTRNNKSAGAKQYLDELRPAEGN